VLEFEGKEIIVVEVPRAERVDKPIYVGVDMFRGSFRRNGEGDYHCTKESVLAMVRDQVDGGIDGKVLENFLLTDLNEDSVRHYRNMFRNVKPTHVWNKLPDESFLVKIGAAKRGNDGQPHPTLAGLLFFADFITITDECPNFFLDYRERKAANARWSDRVCSGDADWSGNIFDFYFRIIDKLTADVKRPFQLNERLLRVDDTPIHKAIREALANALIHADYYGRRGVVIDKEFQKITISNPGTFRISIEEAVAGGISDARNSKIFNMFSLIDVGERSGSGVCDLFNTWQENSLSSPSITEMMDPDRVTMVLFLESGTLEDRNGTLEDGNGTLEDGNGTLEDGNGILENVGLVAKEMIVYQEIKRNPQITIAELMSFANISRRTLFRILQMLKEKGFIRKAGSQRSEWLILK
ncbi:MAG: winged helix-turn-helix transcriptional regulator, partial [Firmicutes bacterium]|nr:winged helix-turn-helix transcriptional regulator [Bacillota bacterium]